MYEYLQNEHIELKSDQGSDSSTFIERVLQLEQKKEDELKETRRGDSGGIDKLHIDGP